MSTGTKRKCPKIPQRHDIRWASCFNLVDTVYKRYQAILITLRRRAEESDKQSIIVTDLYHNCLMVDLFLLS